MRLKLPNLSRHPLLYTLVLSIPLLLIGLTFLTPQVWKLRQGPIQVERWPKSGPQVFSVGPTQESWTSISAVSQHVINAFIVAEDARFYEHFGLDPTEIRKSIAFNMQQKRYARGASTITQQVVKMGFLDSEKSLTRKIREALGASLLEFIMSKDAILEWYINLVEFGDGVFGIKAAAQHYFDTSPELLTIQEATHLALVLPSPNRWSKSLRQKQLSTFGHRRYTQIINELYKLELITPALHELAFATGDFGRPIAGYNPNQGMNDEFIDPYMNLPGDDPPPFGQDPPKRHKKIPQKQLKEPTNERNNTSKR